MNSPILTESPPSTSVAFSFSFFKKKEEKEAADFLRVDNSIHSDSTEWISAVLFVKVFVKPAHATKPTPGLLP